MKGQSHGMHLLLLTLKRREFIDCQLRLLAIQILVETNKKRKSKWNVFQGAENLIILLAFTMEI